MNDNLEKNIKELLKYKGLSQGDLAKKLDVPVHYVNRWLNERGIPKEYISQIANILEQPVSTLQNEDFSNMNLDEIINNKKIANNMLKICFPYIQSNKLNKNFKDAYEIHRKISNYNTLDNIDDFKKKVFESVSLYDKAYSEGIIEALVNKISLLSMYKFLIKNHNFDYEVNSDEVKAIDNFSKINDREKTNILKKISINSDTNKLEDIKKMLLDTTDDVFNLLIKLEDYSEYKNLVDYYLAILFMYNLVNITYTESENALFGKIYMTILCYLENEYALKYIDLFNN